MTREEYTLGQIVSTPEGKQTYTGKSENGNNTWIREDGYYVSEIELNENSGIIRYLKALDAKKAK